MEAKVRHFICLMSDTCNCIKKFFARSTLEPVQDMVANNSKLDWRFQQVMMGSWGKYPLFVVEY